MDSKKKTGSAATLAAFLALGTVGCGHDEVDCTKLDRFACERTAGCVPYYATKIDTSKGCLLDVGTMVMCLNPVTPCQHMLTALRDPDGQCWWAAEGCASPAGWQSGDGCIQPDVDPQLPRCE